MSIQVKPDSVPPVLLHYTPEVHRIVVAVDEALHAMGYHAVITSGMEGTHTRQSAHYKGKAVDFRLSWPNEYRDSVLAAIKRRLGDWGSLVLESDHLHVEVK